MQLLVNGESYEVDVDGETTLLAVLRQDLGLTGTKYGCGDGDCGACTVLLDGEAKNSCITPVDSAAGRAITTITMRWCWQQAILQSNKRHYRDCNPHCPELVTRIKE